MKDWGSQSGELCEIFHPLNPLVSNVYEDRKNVLSDFVPLSVKTFSFCQSTQGYRFLHAAQERANQFWFALSARYYNVYHSPMESVL